MVDMLKPLSLLDSLLDLVTLPSWTVLSPTTMLTKSLTAITDNELLWLKSSLTISTTKSTLTSTVNSKLLSPLKLLALPTASLKTESSDKELSLSSETWLSANPNNPTVKASTSLLTFWDVMMLALLLPLAPLTLLLLNVELKALLPPLLLLGSLLDLLLIPLEVLPSEEPELPLNLLLT
jgi:hypothetical protein